MKYYCVRQHDITDCGAACLATVCKQYGKDLPVARIREVAGTDRRGTNAFGLVKAAKALGFSAKAVKGDQEAFLSEFPLPAIAHVVVDGTLLHYVVIHKITRKQVVIADPGAGIVRLTPEEFFGIAHEGDRPPKYQWTGYLVFLVPEASFGDQVEGDGTLRRFLYLLAPHRRLLAHIFVASVVYVLLGILAAYYFQVIIDDILPASLEVTLTTLSVGVIALNVFRVLLDAIRSHFLLYLSQKLDISLLLGYYQHVTELPMNFFGTRKVGEIISRFEDAGKIRDAISGATLTILIDTVMVVVGGVILYREDAGMFAVTVAMLALYAVIVLAFNSRFESLNREQMEDNAKLTSYLVESLNGIQTIKSYNAEDTAHVETEVRFVRLLRSIFRLSWVTNVQTSLKSAVELIGGAAILWVGALGVINGEITIGTLVVFNSLLAYFLDPLKRLIDLQPQLQTARVAADRLAEILDLVVEKDEREARKIEAASLAGDIEFRGVDFRYGTRQLVLEGLSLRIPCGAKVALVGESGGGKTTIARLLLRLYSPEGGEITIDGTNLEDIRIDSIRDRVVYISQETFLFSGTIRDNIAFGSDSDDLEAIIEASKRAQAHEFVNALPLRYDTMLEENGANLSGGQRQRISIARAMLKDPDILILDEATSNLDAITERNLDRTIAEFAEGKTAIYIAHRLSTIRHCDIIFVVDGGRVVESGTHEELVAYGGVYSRLAAEQSLD